MVFKIQTAITWLNFAQHHLPVPVLKTAKHGKHSWTTFESTSYQTSRLGVLTKKKIDVRQKVVFLIGGQDFLLGQGIGTLVWDMGLTILLIREFFSWDIPVY